MDKKRFKIYSRISKENDLSDDGTLVLTGVASTTNQDLQGDIISPEAMEMMKKHALKLNIHTDHHYALDGVIGHVTEVLDSDDLEIKFIILPKFAKDIKSMLDNGVKLGLSIGGEITDWEEQTNPDGVMSWLIRSFRLFEISLTPMPANWDTFNTVTTSKNNIVESKCLTEACYEIIKKNRGKDKMTKEKKEKNPENEENLNDEKVTNMINEALNTFKEEELPTLKENIKTEILEEINKNNENNNKEESKEEKESTLNIDKLEEKLTKDIKANILKNIGENRNPQHTPVPEKEEEETVEKTYNGIPILSRDKIAKDLAESRSITGLAAVLQKIRE